MPPEKKNYKLMDRKAFCCFPLGTFYSIMIYEVKVK